MSEIIFDTVNNHSDLQTNGYNFSNSQPQSNMSNYCKQNFQTMPNNSQSGFGGQEFYTCTPNSDHMMLMTTQQLGNENGIDPNALSYCTNGVSYPPGSDRNYELSVPNMVQQQTHSHNSNPITSTMNGHSQYNCQSNFDYCGGYYQTNNYPDQNLLKQMNCTMGDSIYGNNQYQSNGFITGYHSSPTSSSYTSTGSDESDDMVSKLNLNTVRSFMY